MTTMAQVELQVSDNLTQQLVSTHFNTANTTSAAETCYIGLSSSQSVVTVYGN